MREPGRIGVVEEWVEGGGEKRRSATVEACGEGAGGGEVRRRRSQGLMGWPDTRRAIAVRSGAAWRRS
jgi:hypothetical protein